MDFSPLTAVGTCIVEMYKKCVFDSSDLLRRREQMEVLVDRPLGNEWPGNLEVECPEFRFPIPPLNS